MWANCGLVFASLSELVGHVNLQHLRPSAPTADPSFSSAQDAQLFLNDSALSCHWENCGMYPNLSSIPSSSSGSGVDQAIDLLTTHLMQDHLGVNVPLSHQAPVSSPRPHQPIVPSSLPASVPSLPSVTSPTPTAQEPTSPAVSSTSGEHICKWQSCGRTFTSCDELTVHLASVHIGSGRAHYDCFWQGCTRNGDSGFSSKQKISRHLQVCSLFLAFSMLLGSRQSHTGHRPFQCKVCLQNFSEAATLQQHMRRHTHESTSA